MCNIVTSDFLLLRTQVIEYRNQGNYAGAREFITFALDYASDSETVASTLTDRRRFRFGFCEDYTGGNF